MSISKGFSLLELLIVIVIVGLLVVIAIPRVFNYVQNARGTEAYQVLNDAIKSQQTYYAEKGYFTDKWQVLGIENNESKTYSYTSEVLDDAQSVLLKAYPKLEEVKGYLAGLKATRIKGQINFEYSICRAKKPGLEKFAQAAAKFKKRRVRCEHSKEID